MKNKIYKYFLLSIIIMSMVSCSQPFTYKYQDKEQYINCNSKDDKLLNEALYSFENDIAVYYKNKILDKNNLNLNLAYANYIFSGAKGTIDFRKIVSKHSISILNLLKKKGYLNNPQSDKTNFNYHKEEVACLFDNIKNEDMRTSLKSQIEVNFLDPKIMADNYRINIREAHTDKYFALFLAFETYYQYLADIDFSK